MEMKCVVANTPRDGTASGRVTLVVGLTFNAKLHNEISTYSTRINFNVPAPQRNEVQLFYLYSLVQPRKSSMNETKYGCVSNKTKEGEK